MSSTLAYHPLHPVAHMYGHAEIEHQQQSYSNNPYFADPTFSVDADADSSYYGVCADTPVLSYPPLIPSE